MAPPRSKKLKLQPADAASGADTINTATKTMDWSLMKLLEIESSHSQIDSWSREVKAHVDAALVKFLRTHKECVSMGILTDVMSTRP